ncbi:DUF5659 domain-containing protein [Clostridium botulinum]|uniref:DUF5659 domain-containing protein n=1 Tax=Clostridium botulinum TaxID=1491 RepID=UPI001C9B0852|nr:DUF5659 domain-containing protein [Clostridium botulinum]MBY6898533.1 hypothetical protein [Clostridium botulinum]MBY6912839.1 hypothetical protein [Clostridium botulinum]MCR1178710.1 DUF5659 domain-containing protein [Clostridium botulinum]
MKVKKIFTKKVAYELIQKGHNLVDMEDNLKHKGFKVYVFEETQELLKDLTQITK